MDTAITLTQPRKALWRRWLRRINAWFRLQVMQHRQLVEAEGLEAKHTNSKER